MRKPERRRPQPVHTLLAAVERLPTAELRQRHPHRAEYPPGDTGDAPSGWGRAGAAGAEGTAWPRPPESCPTLRSCLPPPRTTSARGVLLPLPPTSQQRW